MKYIPLRIGLCFLCLWGVTCNSYDKTTPIQKYVIGSRVGCCGLFSDFLGVLNHLNWCYTHKLTPVVFWGKNSLYYDATFGPNVWEYYFEPVSSAIYAPGVDSIADDYYAPGKNFFYKDIGIANRKAANKLIRRYVTIKPAIQKKAANFYIKNMAHKKTIGIHMRGTDKHQEEVPVALDKFFECANAYAQKGYQFFVASDEQRMIDQARAKIKGKVISYDAQRATNNAPLHTSSSYNKALLGQEVLIEVLLFSRCEKLIHTYSNVSTAALYFNVQLESLLIEA